MRGKRIVSYVGAAYASKVASAIPVDVVGLLKLGDKIVQARIDVYEWLPAVKTPKKSKRARK